MFENSGVKVEVEVEVEAVVAGQYDTETWTLSTASFFLLRSIYLEVDVMSGTL